MSVAVPAPVTTPLPEVVGTSLLAARARAGACTFPGGLICFLHLGALGGNSGIIGI